MLHRLDEKGKSESHSIEQRSVYLRGKIVAICEAILREEMGAIAGSRVLNKLEIELLHHATLGWFTRDEDFLVFVAIDSEADHPCGQALLCPSFALSQNPHLSLASQVYAKRAARTRSLCFARHNDRL